MTTKAKDTCVQTLLKSTEARVQRLAARRMLATGQRTTAFEVREAAMALGLAALEREGDVPAPAPARPRPTVEADEWGNEPPPPTEAPRPAPLPSSKWSELAREAPRAPVDDAEASARLAELAALPDDEAERRFRDLFEPEAP